ncbi:hypothetical protein [Azospirillum sp. SYSU D00513]|uniref:hypothetical protein n=1 Tax=Azospirillum sp. SYSU D00513 TaxID=2812561 RepID=UPI001A969CE9|nr:hypothetical protein [Azospirillum sp. SYSU D00513]
MAGNVTPLHDGARLPFDPALPAEARVRALTDALPKPLQDILKAGRTERRARFGEDGFAGLMEEWLAPEGTQPQHAALARRVLEELHRTSLAPAAPNHLLGRILALLSHFPAKGTTPEVEQMIAMDWADDLGEYPAWALDQAARTWRRTKKWRPSIAEMRALCEEACAAERALAERLQAVAMAGEAAAKPAGGGSVRAMLSRSVRRIA